MAKIDRKYLAHYINAGKEGEPVYERLGNDLEEFSPEMSAQVETKKNILDIRVDIHRNIVSAISEKVAIACNRQVPDYRKNVQKH